MAKKILQQIAFILLLSNYAFAQQDVYDSISFGGRWRTFLTHLPTGYSDKTTYPLVLAFHGGSPLGYQSIQYQSRLSLKADSAGFIVVYPEGVKIAGNRTWNAGGCCAPATTLNIDDVGFTSALLDKLIAIRPIKTARVYATGFSNGALLCYRLANQLSNRFAAIAPVEGNLMYFPWSPSRAVPIISFHSYLDKNIPYFGGVTIGTTGTYFPPQDSIFGVISSNYNCTVLKEVLFNNTNKYDHFKYSACNENVIIEQYVSYDGEHSWPGGLATGGVKVSNQFSATFLMWKFFQNYQLGTKSPQSITFEAIPPITFGTPFLSLSATASSNLPISFTSSDPSVALIDGTRLTILKAGTATITASQAGNDIFESAANVQQQITINKATPTITWANPADVVYGTALSPTQLNASSSIDGSFAYLPVSGTRLNAGNNQNLSVTFTPTDVVNYNSATKQVFINVNKIAPTITWSSPADIVYGTVLGTTQLNATASVNGTLSYTPATGTKLSAGVNQLSVTFTPTDAVNYSSATKVVTINVSKATPAVSWSNPADIVYGTALSSAQLNATSLEGGIFTYTPSVGEKLNAGNGQQLSVTFSPSDAVNFTSVTKQVMLNVSKATPAITWSTPADLLYGTPLSSVQLNATSLVAGTFSYTPAIGVTLNAGNGQQLLVTFAPTDAANYLSTTASVSINVARAQLQISFAAIADKTLGNEPFVLTASSNSSLPVIFSSNSDKVSIANNQVTLLKAGRVSITASQIGNENFNVASSVTQSFCIKPAKPTVTISNINTPTPLLTSNASAGNQWYADGAAIAGATSATFSAIKSGNYKVQVTVDDCPGEFSAEQPLVITGIEVDLPIELYPNPVSDVLTIYFGDLAGNKQATIFTLAGQELISTKTESGSIAIDVSDLSAGMYLAKVIAGGAVHTKKFKKK
jgi:poly(3-hydroxybutyrate) depolymerase